LCRSAVLSRCSFRQIETDRRLLRYHIQTPRYFFLRRRSGWPAFSAPPTSSLVVLPPISNPPHLTKNGSLFVFFCFFQMSPPPLCTLHIHSVVRRAMSTEACPKMVAFALHVLRFRLCFQPEYKSRRRLPRTLRSKRLLITLLTDGKRVPLSDTRMLFCIRRPPLFFFFRTVRSDDVASSGGCPATALCAKTRISSCLVQPLMQSVRAFSPHAHS